MLAWHTKIAKTNTTVPRKGKHDMTRGEKFSPNDYGRIYVFCVAQGLLPCPTSDACISDLKPEFDKRSVPSAYPRSHTGEARAMLTTDFDVMNKHELGQS